MSNGHLQKALASWEERGPAIRRHLKAGESVPCPEIGLPTARITGEAMEVLEYPDGTLAAVIPNPAGLYRAIIQHLVLIPNRQLQGAEATFLRRYLGMSQQTMAELLGCRREKVSRMENQANVSAAYANEIRYFGLLALLNSFTHEERRKCAALFAKMQDVIAEQLENPKTKGAPLRIPVDDEDDAAVELAGSES